MKDSHEPFVKACLLEAHRAFKKGEIPVGCVVVKEGRIIARAHNRTIALKDPTAHAEILAIRKALKKLGESFLYGCTLYVTLEPCAMCAYALVLARVDKVIFLAQDEKLGAVMSLYNLLDETAFNHRVRWEFLPVEEASRLLRDFFKNIRHGKAGEG